MGFSFPHKKSQTKGAVGPDTDHISLNVTSVENDLKNKSPITLSWDNLSYVISGKSKGDSPKVLLDGVNGWVRPGEVVAIMGASGAGTQIRRNLRLYPTYRNHTGKSTLLNVLAGRVNGGVITGDIMVNGRPRPPSSWQSIIGYVEQEDLMYQNLTVFETLRYAALLRLPQTMSYEAKLHRVDEVVQSLSLEKCLHTRIGDSELRGISGKILKLILHFTFTLKVERGSEFQSPSN
jgi:ABC-type multidrug transport system fused ATPase/permease subunit